MQDIHPDLRAVARGNQIIGIICAVGCVLGAAGVVFFSLQALHGGGIGSQGQSPSSSWAWFFGIFAAILALAAWAFLVFSLRWYRRATWVQAHVTPEPMQCTLLVEKAREKQEVTAELTLPDSDTTLPRLGMLWPRWPATPLTDVSVSVYRDPQPKGPVVIETPQGLLWPFPRV